MSLISVVIAKEYLSKVRKRSFIILSLLIPFLGASFILIPIWLAKQTGENKRIYVVDQSGLFTDVFQSDAKFTFQTGSMDENEAKKSLTSGQFDGLLVIPKLDIDHPQGYKLYSLKNFSVTSVSKIERQVNQNIENLRLQKLGLSRETIESYKVNTQISTFIISNQNKETQSRSGLVTGIGLVSGFLIYFFIFFYGNMCFHGVMEEKSSKIAEVIISSVAPFKLMLGKIIGIALVGITQFLIWIVLLLSITLSIVLFTVSTSDSISLKDIYNSSGQNIELISHQSKMDTEQLQKINNYITPLREINIIQIVLVFLFYFIGGYLLYSALFSAVGAASGAPSDAQQFMFPLTAPLIFSIMASSFIVHSPDSSIAFWLSLIPFTSPVVMMIRIPFGVEWWELSLSMLLLILGFIFTTWLSSRIFRIGILMYGSKVNWRILYKWLFFKD